MKTTLITIISLLITVNLCLAATLKKIDLKITSHKASESHPLQGKHVRDLIEADNERELEGTSTEVETKQYTLEISLCYTPETTTTPSTTTTPTETTTTPAGTTTTPSDSSNTEDETKTTPTATTLSETEGETEDETDTPAGGEDGNHKEREIDEILVSKVKTVRMLVVTKENVTDAVEKTIEYYYTVNKVPYQIININAKGGENQNWEVEANLTISIEYDDFALYLQKEIKEGNATFYNQLAGILEGYSYCGSESTTTTPTPETTTTPITTTIEPTEDDGTNEGGTTGQPLPPTQCRFPARKIYKKNDGNKIVDTLNNRTLGIKYYSNTPPVCSVNENNGTITISTNEVTNGVKKCIITCSKDGSSNAFGYFLYQVAEYKPTIDKLLTSFPYKIYPNEGFNATLVLTYPLINGLGEDNQTDLTMKISLNNSEEYDFEESELSVNGKTYFKYENLNITTENDHNGTVTFKFSNTTEYTFYIENVNVAGIAEAATCKVDERDKMGMCCDHKDIIGGSMCKNLTTIIPFVKEIENDLFNAYYAVLETIFNKTNYMWSITMELTNKKKIIVPINIKESEVKHLRQLQGNELSFTDYEFAKSLLSILDCASEDEVQSKIDLLPPEVKEKVTQAGIATALKENINDVVTIAESTGNSVDYTVGITNSYEEVPTVEPQEPTTEPPTTPAPQGNTNDDPWAKKYWYVIFIIVLVVVIILIIAGVMAYIMINKSMKETQQQKTEKIMEAVVPIEQVKQENKVTEDDIYKPFSYEVVTEGYLMKEGRDRIVDKWQRRYCVLYFEPAMLRIYDSMVPSYYGKVYIDEKQNIPLSCYSGIEYSDGANDFTLILKINESNLKTFEPGDIERRIHFKVEGENVDDIAKKWVECFRDFKNQKPKGGDVWTQPVVMDSAEGRYATSTESQAYDRNMTALERAQQRRKEIRKMVPKHPY